MQISRKLSGDLTTHFTPPFFQKKGEQKIISIRNVYSQSKDSTVASLTMKASQKKLKELCRKCHVKRVQREKEWKSVAQICTSCYIRNSVSHLNPSCNPKENETVLTCQLCVSAQYSEDNFYTLMNPNGHKYLCFSICTKP